MKKNLVCCFTGNRPQKVSWLGDKSSNGYKKLTQLLSVYIERLINGGFVNFISGMALGADMICARIVLELKQKYPHIQLECALPCREQTKLWNERDKREYKAILRKADKVTYVSKSYTKGCMFTRNRRMADCSNVVIAMWNGVSSGGTWYTMQYAKKCGKDVATILLSDSPVFCTLI